MDHVKMSKAELFWQIIVFWAVAFTAFEATFSFSFKTNLQLWQVWSDAIISFIFVSDVVYQVRKRIKQKHLPGYRPPSKKENILWWCMIVVDCMACIPFDVISFIFNLNNGIKYLNLIRLFRLVRIIRLVSFLNNLAIAPKWLKAPVIGIFTVIIIHWIACGWVLLYPAPDKDLTTYYIKSIYWVITTLTTIGYGDITPSTNAGRLYTMVIMITGVGVYGVVIGNVARMLTLADRYKEKTREKMSDVSIFMKHYNIPDKLQRAVFGYYRHLFTKRLSDNDTKIISDLPHALQHEIQIYMNIKLISNVPVFKGCGHQCLKEVATALEQKNYSPGQNIVKKGDHGEEMFIIGHGTVDILLEDNNVVASLHEGQFFGEIALLQETTRTTDVRAQDYVDLYVLNKNDFLQIIKRHPSLNKRVEEVAKKRIGNKS